MKEPAIFEDLKAVLDLQHQEHYELKLLESVITHTGDPVMIAQSRPDDELDFKILYVNPAFVEMTGYALSEVRGRSLSTLRGFDSERNDMEKIKAAIKSRRPLRNELLHYASQDQQYMISIALHPVIDGDGTVKHWIGVGRDVTEKRRYIDDIEAQNKKLQEIAWMQSHVIRAPLARLMSLINLIKDYENSPKEQHELLDHLMSSAHTLDDVIRNISSKTGLTATKDPC